MHNKYIFTVKVVQIIWEFKSAQCCGILEVSLIYAVSDNN